MSAEEVKPKMATANVDIDKLMGDLPRTRENLISLAKIAEHAERYPDMCVFMKEAVKENAGEDLSVPDRNLLSVAYKNVVGAKRSSWRTVALPNNEEGEDKLKDLYKKEIEKELNQICNEVLEILKGLTENVKDTKTNVDDSEVFYLKMSGDYHRYLSEINVDDEHHKKKTKEFYEKAMESAKKNLPETHPTRLGLALNFSVCHYEILKQPKDACKLAKEAFDAAIEKLDTLNDDSYKDSTLIMQLLRDNLTLWTSKAHNKDDPEEAEEPK